MTTVYLYTLNAVVYIAAEEKTVTLREGRCLARKKSQVRGRGRDEIVKQQQPQREKKSKTWSHRFKLSVQTKQW